MKPIDPRSYKNPKGWREAYDAFQSFRNMAHKLGEPVHDWSIEFPSTIREKVKGAWSINYTLYGTLRSAYVGYDGLTAADGIRSMMGSYPKHPRKQKTASNQMPKKPSLLADPGMVQKLFWEWNQVIASVGKPGQITEAEFREKYKLHNWMMHRKAGILDMDMMHYLTSHPHAQYWPSPPTSEEQFRARTNELRNIVQQKEARERKDREIEHPPSMGTKWAYDE